MNRNTVIDGTIINLCHARGMEMETAIDLLMDLCRIQITKDHSALGIPTGFYHFEEKRNQQINERSPLFHKGISRIKRIEKAINQVQRGLPHGIKRKQWRKDKTDSMTIIDTFFHVISRKTPQNAEEQLKDVNCLLQRTGELAGAGGRIFETYEGNPALNVEINGNRLSIGKSESRKIIVKGINIGEVRVEIPGDLPESTKIKIADMVGNGEETAKIIDWDGFRGPMPAILMESYIRPDWSGNSENEYLVIANSTGWVEKDMDTGKIHVHAPSRQNKRCHR